MNFIQALREAAKQARDNPGCAIHVNAILETPSEFAREPRISHYEVSDFYSDGQTVRSIKSPDGKEVRDNQDRWLLKRSDFS